VWNNVPIIVFLTLFLVLPLTFVIWIRMMRCFGRWKQTGPDGQHGFDVKLNTADTAKSTEK
jgi:hypothetical protein